MDKEIPIPAVVVDTNRKGFQALVGLAMTSIAGAEVFKDAGKKEDEKDKSKREKLFDVTEGFMRVLATWPENTALELHWSAIPDMRNPSRGIIRITLFLRVSATDCQTAVSDAIQGCFRLQPLLATYFGYMSFAPVTDEKELVERYRPFEVRSGIEIKSVQKHITLSSPIQHIPMGFGDIKPVSAKAEQLLHRYPWTPAPNTEDLFPRALMARMDPIQYIVRLRPSTPVKEELNHLEKAIETCENFLAAGNRSQITLTRQAEMIRDSTLIQLTQLNEISLAAGAFFLSLSPVLEATDVNALVSLFLSNICNRNTGRMFTGGYRFNRVSPAEAMDIEYLPESPITTLEAAAVFQLPTSPEGEDTGLPVRKWRTRPAILGSFPEPSDKSTFLFDNDHQGGIQPVRITNEDRMRHVFLCGQTGCGKSNLMESMILQDMENGYGVMVVDPHGDMCESLMGRIPKKRTGDVILFDILDREMPIGFNLLEWKTLDERDLIIDEMYQSLDLMYDMRNVGGPIFENNFRKMLALLMSDGDCGRKGFTPTIFDFIRCYKEDEFREWLRKTVLNEDLLDFILELEETRGDSAIHNMSPYITSKFGRFTSDRTLKRIFGQEKTGFSFDEILEQQKILLVKMGRGRVGSVVSSLLATQLLLRLKLAAMKRGELAARRRKDFFLYIDEAGLIPSHSIGDILSEARKFRLGLTLASQYTSQLSSAVSTSHRDTLLDAVFGNVGTCIAFRLGKEDAIQMETLFWPEFSILDIVRLPNFCGYAKVHLNNQVTPPFSFKTRYMDSIPLKEQAEKIKAQSQFLYGFPAEEVDKQIRKHRNAWKALEKDEHDRELRDKLNMR